MENCKINTTTNCKDKQQMEKMNSCGDERADDDLPQLEEGGCPDKD
jgi:hypothetical protein